MRYDRMCKVYDNVIFFIHLDRRGPPDDQALGFILSSLWVLYLAISTKDDCKRLQQYLDRMVNWTKTWQMIFNPLKCYVLKITKKKKKTVDFDYNINGQTLETVASNPYLESELTNTMSWDKQVQKVVTKGNIKHQASYVEMYDHVQKR